MSDLTPRQDEQIPLTTKVRYKDMGDGTHALVYGVALLADIDGEEPHLLAVDAHEGALVTVDHYTHSVHVSERFKASYLLPHGSELGNDATYDALIVVGSIAAHACLRVSTGGDSDLLLYENPTISANGTTLSILSKNREAKGTTATKIYDTPTVTGAGTLLFSWFVIGGSGQKSLGGEWGETPWVLAPNMSYLLRITNRSGAAIQLSYSLGWSEHA